MTSNPDQNKKNNKSIDQKIFNSDGQPSKSKIAALFSVQEKSSSKNQGQAPKKQQSPQGFKVVVNKNTPIIPIPQRVNPSTTKQNKQKQSSKQEQKESVSLFNKKQDASKKDSVFFGGENKFQQNKKFQIENTNFANQKQLPKNNPNQNTSKIQTNFTQPLFTQSQSNNFNQRMPNSGSFMNNGRNVPQSSFTIPKQLSMKNNVLTNQFTQSYRQKNPQYSQVFNSDLKNPSPSSINSNRQQSSIPLSSPQSKQENDKFFNQNKGQFGTKNKGKKYFQDVDTPVSYAIKIYEKLRNNQTLNDEDNDIIKHNFHLLIRSPQDNSLIDKPIQSNLFTKIQGDMKQKFKNYWTQVAIKLQKNIPHLSQTGAIKLCQQHLYQNLDKYLLQNKTVVNIQKLVQLGCLFQIQPGKYQFNTNCQFFQRLVLNIQQLYTTYLQTLKLIFNRLTGQEYFFQKKQTPKFVKETIINITNSFLRVCTYNQRQVDYFQILIIVDCLSKFYDICSQVYSEDIKYVAPLIDFVDQHYQIFRGKQQEKVVISFILKMVLNPLVIQKIKKGNQEFKIITQSIRNIKKQGLRPLYWLLYHIQPRQQKNNKPEYFIIKGAHYKPLIDQLIFYYFSKPNHAFGDMLFICVCSIIKERAQDFWENQSQFTNINKFIRYQCRFNDPTSTHSFNRPESKRINDDSVRRIAKIMECSMGQKSYPFAYHTIGYFLSHFIDMGEQNPNEYLLGNVFIKFILHNQNALQIRNKEQILDPFNFDTDHAIYSFLLKAIEGYPQALLIFSQLSYFNQKKEKKQIQCLIAQALMNNYIHFLNQNETEQINQVFRTLNALLQCDQTRQIVIPLISLRDSSRSKNKQLLKKVILNPNNYSILAQHLVIIFKIKKKLKEQTWMNLIVNILNSSVQDLQMNQLGGYGKLANSFYQSILKMSSQNKSNINEHSYQIFDSNKNNRPKINQYIILKYLQWCFQIEEDNYGIYHSTLLLRKQYQQLSEGVKLLKNLLLIINAPQTEKLAPQNLKNHLLLTNTNGRSQIQLRDSKETSYAAIITIILKNSNRKYFYELQKQTNIQFQPLLINTLSLLILTNQKYLRENDSQKYFNQGTMNFDILNIYHSHFRIRNIKYQNYSEIYFSATQMLISYIKSKSFSLCLELLINLPFSILSFDEVNRLVNQVMKYSNANKNNDLLSVSRFLTYIIRKVLREDKTQNDNLIIQIIKWIVQNTSVQISNKLKFSKEIQSIVQNIIEALLVASVQSNQNNDSFLNILKDSISLILHPGNLKSIQISKNLGFQTNYEKGLLIVFSCKSFLTQNQFDDLCSTSNIQSILIKFFEELIKYHNHERLGLFCLQFILNIEEYKSSSDLFQVVKYLQTNLLHGQNAVAYVIFISMYCKSKQNATLQSIDNFINNATENTWTHQNPLFLCVDYDSFSNSASALRLAQITYQNSQIHPILHTAACNHILQIVLSFQSSQYKYNQYSQSLQLSISQILNSIQRTFKKKVPSFMTIWGTTFMFYICTFDPNYVKKIQHILFENSIIMGRLSYLMNKIKQTNWMEINNQIRNKLSDRQRQYTIGLSLLEKTEMFCILRCLSSAYNHHENWDKSNQKFGSLCRSILRAIPTFTNLFFAKGNQNTPYEKQLSLINTSQLLTKSSFVRQVEISKLSVLDIFHQHINLQITKAFLIMLKVVLVFPIQHDRLNQESIIELTNNLLDYYIEYQKKLKNTDLLKVINDKYFDSYYHSILLHYTNSPAVTQNIQDYKEAVQTALYYSLQVCKSMQSVLNMTKQAPKYKKSLNRIYHKIEINDFSSLNFEIKQFYDNNDARSSYHNTTTKYYSQRVNQF